MEEIYLKALLSEKITQANACKRVWQACLLSEGLINGHWLILRACGLSCQRSVCHFCGCPSLRSWYTHTHKWKSSCWESYCFSYVSTWSTRYLRDVHLFSLAYIPQPACGRQLWCCKDPRAGRDPAAPAPCTLGSYTDHKQHWGICWKLKSLKVY